MKKSFFETLVENNQKGFGFAELIIVVGMVGSIGVVVSSQLKEFRHKTDQMEAKVRLREIHTAMTTHLMQNPMPAMDSWLYSGCDSNGENCAGKTWGGDTVLDNCGPSMEATSSDQRVGHAGRESCELIPISFNVSENYSYHMQTDQNTAWAVLANRKQMFSNGRGYDIWRINAKGQICNAYDGVRNVFNPNCQVVDPRTNRNVAVIRNGDEMN